MDALLATGENQMPLCMDDVFADILLVVLDYLSAFDLESFTFTCNRWRAVAARRLVEHDRL